MLFCERNQLQELSKRPFHMLQSGAIACLRQVHPFLSLDTLLQFFPQVVDLVVRHDKLFLERATIRLDLLHHTKEAVMVGHESRVLMCIFLFFLCEVAANDRRPFCLQNLLSQSGICHSQLFRLH